MAKFKESYDIDLKSIYSKYVNLEALTKQGETNSKILESISSFKSELKIYLKDCHYTLKKFEQTPFMVVPSKHNMYDLFLTHDLFFRDVFQIDRYLDYHYSNFKSNYYAKDQSDFLGVLEFTVSNRIDKAHPTNDKKRLRRVTKWIRDKKGNFVPHHLEILSRKISLGQSDLAKFHEIIKPYFSKSDQVNLAYLLEGKPISGTLLFKAEANKLCHAFYRLLKSGKIQTTKEALSDWIQHYFKCGKRKKLSKPFTKAYTWNIISKALYQCKNPIKEIEEWLGR